MTQKRTESFVPLTSAPDSPQRADFRVKVISQPGLTKPFEQLEVPPASPTNSDTALLRKACEPRVSVQREGERVTSIRIQCSCGEILDLACIYPQPVKSA